MLFGFLTLCFCVWFGVFLPFFCRSSFLRVAVWKNLRERTCFWVLVLVLCFLVVFCWGFGLILWRFAPESVWKNSLDVRSVVFKKFSGANFCFWGVGVGHVFVGAVLLMFLLYVLAVRSRRCLENFSWCQVSSPFGSCVFFGPVSGSAVLLFSLLPLVPPALGVGPGFFSSLLVVCRQDIARLRKARHCSTRLALLHSFFSLCPGRLPSPSLASPSFSLSLSLACIQISESDL